MAVEIPVQRDTPAFTQRVTLDGSTFHFDIRFNQREGAWYFTLSDQEEGIITAGRRIVIGTPLLRRVVDQRRPPGEIFAVDVTGEDREPGLEDLGRKVRLIYLGAE